MLRQVVCSYVRATPSLQGTQLYLLAKVIIFHQFFTFLCLLFEGQHLEAFQRRRASSLVNYPNILPPIYSSSTFSHQNYTYSSKPPRKSQEICNLSSNNHEINRKLLTVNYKLLFPTSASYNKAVPSRKIWRGL